jgi:mono/diheme cytochrome c family protein
LLACGGDKKTTTSTTTSKQKTSTASASVTKSETANRKGKLVYKQYCVICHGADGKLAVSGATDLSASTATLEERINQITNGKGLMTPYKDILSQEQIKSVAEYIEELRK